MILKIRLRIDPYEKSFYSGQMLFFGFSLILESILLGCFPALVLTSNGIYTDGENFATSCSDILTKVEDEIITQETYAKYLNGLCSSWNCTDFTFSMLPAQLQIIFAMATCLNITRTNLSTLCDDYEETPDPIGIYLGIERPISSLISEQIFHMCEESWVTLVEFDIVRLGEGKNTKISYSK